jgi:hypothetical protein
MVRFGYLFPTLISTNVRNFVKPRNIGWASKIDSSTFYEFLLLCKRFF